MIFTCSFKGGRPFWAGALAVIGAGVLVTGCSAVGSAAPTTAKSASRPWAVSTATVLVLGLRFVTQINAATQTADRHDAVQRSEVDSGNGLEQGVAFAKTPRGLTAYVVVSGGVMPIDLDNHTIGKFISIGTTQINAIAASPDGATVYVASGAHNPDDPGEITPVDTRVNGVGQPITVGMEPDTIAFAPNGKTAYVADDDNFEVTPINVATGRARRPVRADMGGTTASIVFTPDGKTAYVGAAGGQITPIDVSTGVAGTRIPGSFLSMAIAPDGKTLYVLGAGRKVTPVNTTTNSPGTPLTANAANSGGELVTSPDGKTLYVLNEYGDLTVISTVANTVGKRINTSPDDYPRTMAITADVKTVYITSRVGVSTFDTASQTIGKPIMLSGPAGEVAIAP